MNTKQNAKSPSAGSRDPDFETRERQDIAMTLFPTPAASASVKPPSSGLPPAGDRRRSPWLLRLAAAIMASLCLLCFWSTRHQRDNGSEILLAFTASFAFYYALLAAGALTRLEGKSLVPRLGRVGAVMT